MSATAKKVQAILGKDVEEDVVEWVVSALNDGGYETVTELSEGVAGMLEASGIISDEDAALPIAKKLWDSKNVSKTATATVNTSAKPQAKVAGGLRKPALRAPRVPKSAPTSKLEPSAPQPGTDSKPAVGLVDMSGLASKLAARGVGQKVAAPERGADGKMLSAPVSLASAADELAGARGAVMGSLMSGGSTEYKSQNKLIEWSEADKDKAKKTVERMKRRAAAKNRKADDMDSGEDLIQMLLKEQQRQLEQDTAVAQVPWHAAGITGTTSLRVGSKDLFIDAEIRIRPGRRYGLVGANGTGKTTILRHLAAHAIPNVQVPHDARIIHVNQEVPGEQRSAIAVVIASDVRRTKLLQDEADCMAALEELERAEAFAAAMAKEAAAAAEATQAAAPETGAAAAAPAEGVSVPSEAAAGGVGAAAAAPAGAEAGHTSATGAVDSGPDADPQGGASGDPDGGDGDGQGKGDGAGGTGGHLSRFKGAAHFAEVKSRSKGDASKSKRKKTSAELQAVYTQIQAALTDIDAFTAESRAAEILSGLQFSQSMMTMSTEQLSGGWRMRVALACGLFATPDILCCDESTVHLDFAAVEWLQSYLCEHYGSASSPTKSIVVVSHDRAFLNGLATDIMHLANHKLEYYRGNYDSFDKQRVERAKEAARQAEAHAAKIAHMQSFVDKFRASAARASQAQSRVKAIEKLRREGAGGAAASAAAAATGVGLGGTGVRLHFPDPGPLGTPVLQIKDVSFGYKEVAEGSTDDEAAGTISLLFQNVSFGVDMSSRIAILGPNGVGKSTLLKLISGELEAREGQIDRNSHLRIAKFDQHHMEGMDPEATPLSWLQTKHPEGTRGMNETELRSWLGKYGLSGMLATQQIKVLSGGQKSRVSIATMLFSKPHIVLLDEPSNFLDIDAVDALIEGIKEFAGGVVMVSHDEHLIDNVATTLLVAGYPYPGAITRYRGTLAKYRKEVEGLSRVDMSRMHDHEGGDIADEAELGALTKGTAAETPAVAAASSNGGR